MNFIYLQIFLIFILGFSFLSLKFLSNSDVLAKFTALSTGLILGLVFLEWLPEVQASGYGAFPLLGLGLIIFFEIFISPFLDRIWPAGETEETCEHSGLKHSRPNHVEHSHHQMSHSAACSAVGCLMVCCFFDGFSLQSVAQDMSWESVVGVLSLGVHLLPDMLAATAIALSSGLKGKSIYVLVALYLSVTLGSLMSYGLAEFGAFGELPLALSVGVILYVALVHLLPQIFKKSWHFWIFVFGIGLVAAFH